MTDLRHLLAIYMQAHRTGNSVPPHIDAEARAALADEPAVPEGREPASVTGQPSDEDLWNTADLVFQVNSWPKDAIRYARAVLTRWGNRQGSLDSSAPQPVPVSERLPEAKDCDDQKRCWWLVHQSWPCLYLMKADSGLAAAVATHWLPAHALPLPEAER